jgi:CubicO group peptidase (beta-lactamase class C family)
MSIVKAAAALRCLLLAACLLPSFSKAEEPSLPTNPNMLFWSQSQRDGYFPHMDQVFPVNRIARGDHVHQLEPGAPLASGPSGTAIDDTIARYMDAEHTAGIVVLQHGRIRYERYALGYAQSGRWTSFSVAKSFTSTLVGVAIKDGYIASLDDPVVKYLPDLKGSAYDDVTVRQLLSMTSGVKWNEDYTDPNSDVARFSYEAADPGVDQTVSYMRKLPREAPPGTKWVYKTGETNLVGVLVTAATHHTLSDYLSTKIWAPYGMEQDAFWLAAKDTRQEPGGCCISAALRDYARFGQFVMQGGVIDGKAVVPDDWFSLATRTQVATDQTNQGYGFQWWTNPDGTYEGRGIFGQMIHIDPKRELVIAMSSSWPTAVGVERIAARNAMVRAITAAAN